MSGFNKFLETGGGDASGLTDGSTALNSASITAANLLASLPMKTDVSRIVQSTKLDIADTLLLQTALDSKLANPMTANLDAGQFNIFDLDSVKIDTAGGGANVATLEYNGTGSVTIDLAALASHVDSSSIPSVNNRLTVYDGVGGETIRQSTTILESAGSLTGIVNLTNTGTINTPDNININTVHADSITKYGFQSATNAALDNSVCIGENCGQNATTSSCVYIGNNAAIGCTVGGSNVVIGHDAMSQGTGGGSSIAIGQRALYNVTNAAAVDNVALGVQSLQNLTTGFNNIAVGDTSGTNITTTSNNIFIGSDGVAGDSAKIRLGDSNHTQTFIRGIYNVNPAGSNDEMVIMDDAHQLGTQAIPIIDADTVTHSSGTVVVNQIPVYAATDGLSIKASVTLIDGSGNMTGVNNLTAVGAIDFNTISSLDVVATSNISNAVKLLVNGGGSAGIDILNTTGTSADSILLSSTGGGIQFNSDDGTNIASGGFSIASNIGMACNTAPVVTNSIAKFSGTTGGLVSESGVIIDGSNNLTGINDLTMGGTLTVNSNPVLQSTTEPVVTDTIPVYSGTGGILVKETGVTIDGSNNMDIQSGQLTTAHSIIIDTIDGSTNTRYGFDTLDSVSGIGNTMIGSECGTAGLNNNNTGVGKWALENSAGSSCVGIGTQSMRSSGAAVNSTCVGILSGASVTGNQNVVVGAGALGLASGTAASNSILGYSAVSSGTNCTFITAIGENAGDNYTTESRNIVMDNAGVASDSGAIRIGNATDYDYCQIPKELRIEENAGSNYVGIKVPTLAGNYDLELPNAQVPTDEEQALVNRNGVLSWVNGSDMPLPGGYLSSYLVAWLSDSTFSFASGACRSGSGDPMNLNRGNRSMNLATSGVGGIQADDFPAQNNTWYALYVIGDSSGVNPVEGILMEYGTALNTTGYTSRRRIGAIRVDSGGDIVQFGNPDSNGRNKLILWQISETVAELLTNGTATTWTNVDLSELVPPSSRVAHLNTNHTAVGSEDFASFRTGGLGGGTSPVTNPKAHRCYAGSTAEAGGSNAFFINVDNNATIDYGNSSAGEDTDLWVLGYIDNLDT